MSDAQRGRASQAADGSFADLRRTWDGGDLVPPGGTTGGSPIRSPGPRSSSTGRSTGGATSTARPWPSTPSKAKVAVDPNATPRRAGGRPDAANVKPETSLNLLRNEDAEIGPDRLLLLPLPRLRGLPARLLLPSASARGLHPWWSRHARTTRRRLPATSTVPRHPRVRPRRPDLPRGRPLRGRPCPTTPQHRGRRRDRRGATLRGLRLPPPRRGRHRRLRRLRRTTRPEDLRAAAAPDRLHPPARADLQRRGGAPPVRLRAGGLLPLPRSRRPARRDRRTRRRRRQAVAARPRLRRRRHHPPRQRRSPPPQGRRRPRLLARHHGGRWLSDKQAADATVDTDELDADLADVPTKAKVIPYVEDTRNIVVLRHTDRLDDVAATTLRYALERGAEACFQLEDSELDSQAAPRTSTDRGGCCSPSPPRAAPACCAASSSNQTPSRRSPASRWSGATSTPTPATTSTTPPEPRSAANEPATTAFCPTATNFEHASSTGHLVRDLLLDLEQQPPPRRAGERGRQPATSSTRSPTRAARAEVRRLARRARPPPPGRAQVTVSEGRRPTRPRLPPATGPRAVFVDGPVHDDAAQAERDADAEERLDRPRLDRRPSSPRRRLGGGRQPFPLRVRPGRSDHR